MPTYTCTCGAGYKLPEGSEGKRARCKKCGVVFTIPQEPLEVAPPDDDYWDFEANRSQTPPVPEGSRFGIPAGGTAAGHPAGEYSPEELVAKGRAAMAGATKVRGFWADVGWTFALFTEPNNLAMLVIVWVLHALLPVVAMAVPVCCFFFLGYLVIYGWLCSYWFNVIEDAAAGEDRLPSLSLTEGILDDVIIPFLKFVGATVLATAPAIVCGLVVALASGVAFGQTLSNPTGPLVATIAVSMFLLPMVLLVTAIGGIFSVIRVDLLCITIVRTFPAYLAVCLLVGGTSLLEGFAKELAGLATGGGLQSFWVTLVLTSLLQAYFSIVSMRIVGLYYHHFKKRFAWSWG